MSTPRLRAQALLSDLTKVAEEWRSRSDGAPPPDALQQPLFALRRETAKHSDHDAERVGKEIGRFFWAAAEVASGYVKAVAAAEQKDASIDAAEAEWVVSSVKARAELDRHWDQLAALLSAWVEREPLPPTRLATAYVEFQEAATPARCALAARKLGDLIALEAGEIDVRAYRTACDLRELADAYDAKAAPQELRERSLDLWQRVSQLTINVEAGDGYRAVPLAPVG